MCLLAGQPQSYVLSLQHHRVEELVINEFTQLCIYRLSCTGKPEGYVYVYVYACVYVIEYMYM